MLLFVLLNYWNSVLFKGFEAFLNCLGIIISSSGSLSTLKQSLSQDVDITLYVEYHSNVYFLAYNFIPLVMVLMVSWEPYINYQFTIQNEGALRGKRAHNLLQHYLNNSGAGNQKSIFHHLTDFFGTF